MCRGLLRRPPATHPGLLRIPGQFGQMSTVLRTVRQNPAGKRRRSLLPSSLLKFLIIDGQKLLLRPSGWRHWTLNPGFYQISYSLKNNTWKDISVYGNDTTSGKVMRLKYRVITEW